MRIDLCRQMRDPLLLAKAMGASLSAVGRPGRSIGGIASDSREVQRGDLFLALRGQNCHGTAYLEEALRRGASALVVPRGTLTPSGDYWCFTVADTVGALLAAAAARRQSSRARVVAISGSTGKTTTKEAIASVLAVGGLTVRKSGGNFNSLVGMPLSLLGMEDADYFVLELGINHPSEMERMSRALRPDIGVLTNIGTAHLGNFTDSETLIAEKMKLAVGQGDSGVLLTGGDPSTLRLAPRGARVIRVGTEPSADIRAVNISISEKGVSADIKSRERVITNLNWHIPGSIGLSVLLFSAGVAMLEGRSDSALRQGLDLAKLAVPRMRLFSIGKRTFLDDTYNASLEAVRAALETACILAAGRPVIAVLGDMQELGSFAVPLHRTVGAYAATHGVRQLFAYGDYAAEIARGAREAGMNTSSVLCFAGGEEAELADAVLRETPGNAFFLFKASRKTALDRVLLMVRERL